MVLILLDNSEGTPPNIAYFLLISDSLILGDLLQDTVKVAEAPFRMGKGTGYVLYDFPTQRTFHQWLLYTSEWQGRKIAMIRHFCLGRQKGVHRLFIGLRYAFGFRTAFLSLAVALAVTALPFGLVSRRSLFLALWFHMILYSYPILF